MVPSSRIRTAARRSTVFMVLTFSKMADAGRAFLDGDSTSCDNIAVSFPFRVLSGQEKILRAARTVLPCDHGHGQAQTRATNDDVDSDVGLADGRKPPVLSTLESIAARVRVRRLRRGPMCLLLCRDDGSTGVATW